MSNIENPDQAALDAVVPSSPKHIALVIHALYGGGAERLMSQLANRWSAAGHRVQLVTLARTETDQYATSASVERHGLDLMQPSRGLVDGVRANWQRVRALRKLLTELAPDAILSFCDRMNITTITAALPLGKPMWIAEHSDPSRQHLGLVWETWRQWSYRQLARRPSSGCVVLTDSIAETMHARFHRLKCAVIPPAIHLNDCTNTIAQGAPALPTQSTAGSASGYRLLSMGRHSIEKNISGLLKAWEELAPQFPQWRLVVAGDGPQHAELLEQARKMQHGERVDFLGWVSDPWSLYRQSSLLAMASHYEGVPVAMLEAMAAGVPCVTTPCCSSVLEFASAGAVELAQSSEPSDIARTLSVAMKDAVRRREMGERGRALAQGYSWDVIGPRWDELLSKLA